MYQKLISVVIVLVFGMTFFSLGSIPNESNTGSQAQDQILVNNPGTGSNPGGSQCYISTSSSGDTNIIYITSTIMYKGSQPYIVFLFEEQATAKPGSSQTIASGDNAGAMYPTYSAKNGIRWFSYCSTDTESTSYWPWTGTSISEYASPDDCLYFGASGDRTVTIGANAGASYENFGVSGSYTYSMSFPIYAFYECPIILHPDNYCFRFSDNEGAFGGTPKAFTLYYLTQQEAIPGHYMHIYFNSTAQFVKCCTDLLGIPVPNYSDAEVIGGYNVYIPQ
ncbi:hypothetical protein ACNF40_05010 [Cuniculiplasma sp. SKW4]|uniref:hypothetical protein n=1 Tax=Cuniculiplasma sp. SKW4 TaxID=3400171 RepID=UPI003FD65FF7